MTKALLVVFHSMTGGTRQMAQAAARAAAAEGVAVRLLEARDATAEDVLAADAFVFATPENLAAMAGLMKDFFDRTYYAVLGRVEGRSYAVMVCAGSDGANAVRQVARIATGWRLREAAEPIIICTHAQTAEAILAPKTISPEDIARCEELGATLAAGLAIGMF